MEGEACERSIGLSSRRVEGTPGSDLGLDESCRHRELGSVQDYERKI